MLQPQSAPRVQRVPRVHRVETGMFAEETLKYKNPITVSKPKEVKTESKSKKIIKFIPCSKYADIDSLDSDGTAQSKQTAQSEQKIKI